MNQTECKSSKKASSKWSCQINVDFNTKFRHQINKSVSTKNLVTKLCNNLNTVLINKILKWELNTFVRTLAMFTLGKKLKNSLKMN